VGLVARPEELLDAVKHAVVVLTPGEATVAPEGEVIAAHGRLDILVNNAGITIDKTCSSSPTRTGSRC
jgi:NAD(P)-dependent dehydrogenase (short-subunit alcohol dehydrogenase family)